MILIMIFILLFSVGIALLFIDAKIDFYIPEAPILICTLGGACGLFFSVIALICMSQSSYIEREISNYKIERLGIEQNYKESMQTSDKHRQMSAVAKIVTWNEEVESYKRHAKNPIIGDFYPKEVAESLQYIDLESEDL